MLTTIRIAEHTHTYTLGAQKMKYGEMNVETMNDYLDRPDNSTTHSP